MATPSPSGLFAVAADQRKLALACWGHGAPAVVLDAGSSDAGLARWRASVLVADLAATTTVCTYDRAGLGESEAAPRRARVLDDVTSDLHKLLAAARIPRPVVMVGASGGGFDVYQHAGRYPADVAGLVMLDVPAGQRSMSHSDGPPEWSDPANPEHVDYYAVEHQMAVARLKIRAIPVTVVTAKAGQSADPAEQRVWLAGSSRPVQVVIDGGHDIAFDAPGRVLKEILAVVAAA
ncbi:MAG: alpha/beta hydrolase [Actinomycetia bacterium]|nr:alpha/beta hydrolase [Actinomycetes bacterium]